MALYFRGWGGNFTGWGQVAAPAVASDRGVVLFPAEALRFRSRWDKTAYAVAVFTRDMRAPTEGYRPMREHLVSAVALARR